MPAITGFKAVDESGFPVLCHAHGNNVAFRCLGCGSPVLAVLFNNQPGINSDRPTTCPACEARYWVEVKESPGYLVVHRQSQ